MSILAARRAEYQASQQGEQNSSASATDGGATARWSTTDYWALEEAVVGAPMGLLFVKGKA